MVIEFMAQGYSLTAFAGSIRKSREAVYTWIRVHREFADAVTRARSARVAALEAKLLRSRKGAETTAAIFALKNAEPTEWRDLKHTSHVHSLKPSDLTDAQLNAIASGASPADAGVIEGDFSVVEPGSETG
jgi:hypothetical protein